MWLLLSNVVLLFHDGCLRLMRAVGVAAISLSDVVRVKLPEFDLLEAGVHGGGHR